MKGTRKWALASLVVGTGLIVSPASVLVGQVVERVAQADACPQGTIEEGTLGISGLDCIGECSLTIWKDGTERSWSFSTEPRILGVEGGSPAVGVLRPGDFLVSIDGILITTKEGGVRYATLEPGETVRVRFRRDGRVGEAAIAVVGRCRDLPEPPAVTSRIRPPPPKPDEPRTVGIAVAPKVRVAPELQIREPGEKVVGVTPSAGARPMGILTPMPSTGRLGIQFQCGPCGTQEDEKTGESIWFFSGPLEVTGVTPGGPAERAGIQIGDLIKAINGHAMETGEGGLAFTRLRVGETARLTIVKRNGSEVDVALTPEARGVAGLVEPVSGGVAVSVVPRPAPPPPADRVPIPEPAGVSGAPGGMPLRYSGSMQGVEIEVRGDPVFVSEVKGTRTIYINAEGLWIRITVPPSGDIQKR